MILTQDEPTVLSPAGCFHQIAEAAPVPAWVADADGGVVFASRRLVEYTGTPARHLRAGAWVGLLHPGDRDRVVAAWDRAVATGEPFREEFRLRRADGVYRWHVGHAALVPDPAGVAGWWFGTATDAHDRHEADAALRESEARYRQLFESNPHPMWVYDAETLGFLAVNDAAVARYGYSRDEFLRMTIADIRPPEDVGALADAIRALPPGLHPGGAWRHRWKDGTVRDVEVESHDLAYGGRPAWSWPPT